MSSSWKSLAVVALSAAVTLVAADRVANWLSPVHVLWEAEDAIALYEHEDPTVLVLAPSHGRTFTYYDRLARERSDDAVRFVAVPVEGGKFTTLLWTLENRLLPFIDEKNDDGTPKRPSLEEFVLVAEWWDAMAPDEGFPSYNLPARVWSWSHFYRDVAENGLTAYNRNFINERWRMLWRRSALVQDRGHGRILNNLGERIRPTDPAILQAQADHAIEGWARYIEEGIDRIDDPREWAAFERIFQLMQERGVGMTLLLYPRLPASLTEANMQGTLGVFAREAKALCDRYGVRFIDWSVDSPLGDEHFYADLDHVTPEGNRILAEWGLDGDLSFLMRTGHREWGETR